MNSPLKYLNETISEMTAYLMASKQLGVETIHVNKLAYFRNRILKAKAKIEDTEFKDKYVK
jgi:hypothetical protein